MSATNPATRALYTRLREVLGAEHAETLMMHLPTAAGDELATTSDLFALGARLDERFDRIDQRFEEIDGRFEKIDGRFEKIDQRFEKIDERLYAFQGTLNAQYKTYTLTMVGAMSALTAIYAGLLAVIALVG